MQFVEDNICDHGSLLLQNNINQQHPVTTLSELKLLSQSLQQTELQLTTTRNCTRRSSLKTTTKTNKKCGNYNETKNTIEKFLLKGGFPNSIEMEPYCQIISEYLIYSFEIHLKTPIILSKTEELLNSSFDINTLINSELNPKIGVIFPNKDKTDPERKVIGSLNVIKVNTLKSKIFVQSERRGRFYGWIDIDNKRLCSNEHVIHDIFGVSDHVQEIDECDNTSSIIIIDNILNIPNNINEFTDKHYNFNIEINFMQNYCNNTNHVFQYVGIIGIKKSLFNIDNNANDTTCTHSHLRTNSESNSNLNSMSFQNNTSENVHLSNIHDNNVISQFILQQKDLLFQLKNYLPFSSQYHDDNQWLQMKLEFNEQSIDSSIQRQRQYEQDYDEVQQQQQQRNVFLLNDKNDIEYLMLDQFKNASYSFQRELEDLHIDGTAYNTQKITMSVDNNTDDKTFQFSIKGDNCKETKPLKLKDDFQYILFMAFPNCTCLFQRGCLTKFKLF